MTTETKRDLQADLALCEAATAGPWFASGEDERPIVAERESVVTARGSELAYVSIACEDEEFIAESREGWPEALCRAIAAEAEVERLDARYQSMFSRALEVNKARDSYSSAVHQAIYYLREERVREALLVLTEVSADASR